VLVVALAFPLNDQEAVCLTGRMPTELALCVACTSWVGGSHQRRRADQYRRAPWGTGAGGLTWTLHLDRSDAGRVAATWAVQPALPISYRRITGRTMPSALGSDVPPRRIFRWRPCRLRRWWWSMSRLTVWCCVPAGPIPAVV